VGPPLAPPVDIDMSDSLVAYYAVFLMK